MFGRIALARAYLAARRTAVDYEERVIDGERFLFGYCRFCRQRLAGASLTHHDRARAERRLLFSIESHLQAGCPAQPPEHRPGQQAR
jgi:hypothetical protein